MADSSDTRDVRLNELADAFAARQRAGDRPRLEEYCDATATRTWPTISGRCSPP